MHAKNITSVTGETHRHKIVVNSLPYTAANGMEEPMCSTEQKARVLEHYCWGWMQTRAGKIL